MEQILDLAIQIVNFNTKDYLLACLQSVFQDLSRSQISFEINILDNASKDNLVGLINLFAIEQGEKLKIWQSEKNLGFGGGHNLLAKNTAARHLLILNPDIIIKEKESIDRLYKRMLKDPAIKVIGPKLYNQQGKSQPWDHGEDKGILALALKRAGLGFWLNRQKEIECGWVSGAVFLIEKSVFDQVGGFDQNFFLYKEEEDLCLRIKKLGAKYKVLYFPEVKIMHINSVVAKKKIYLSASQAYYLKKHRFGSR